MSSKGFGGSAYLHTGHSGDSYAIDESNTGSSEAATAMQLMCAAIGALCQCFKILLVCCKNPSIPIKILLVYIEDLA